MVKEKQEDAVFCPPPQSKIGLNIGEVIKFYNLGEKSFCCLFNPEKTWCKFLSMSVILKTKIHIGCVHTFSEKYLNCRDDDRFLCKTRMNAICRALKLFCLFPAKILVRLLVFLEWKLTATNHSKAHEVYTCFRINPSIGRFLWRRSLYG